MLVLVAGEAAALALREAVTLGPADALPVAPVLSLGLVLSPAGLLVPPAAGLLLVLPVAGLVAGVAFGVTRVAGAFEADGAALDGHTVVFALLWPMALLLWLRPVAEGAIGLPVPAAVPAPLLLLLCGPSPAAVPSWMKASRSGGTAMATPTANTAQAMARAGRSSLLLQSSGCRAWPRSAPRPLPAPRPWPAPGASSRPCRQTSQRRTRPARKPPGAAAPFAAACLLA